MILLKRSKKDIISFKMSMVKSRNTDIENILSKTLYQEGLKGYRRNVKGVPGTPDFCWKSRRVAVFCDSSFWHGYKWEEAKGRIKVRRKFWFNKIETNIKRDRRIKRELEKDGWKVLRFWDFQIKKCPDKCIQRIARCLDMN